MLVSEHQYLVRTVLFGRTSVAYDLALDMTMIVNLSVIQFIVLCDNTPNA